LSIATDYPAAVEESREGRQAEKGNVRKSERERERDVMYPF
jgi:hypothetical protein